MKFSNILATAALLLAGNTAATAASKVALAPGATVKQVCPDGEKSVVIRSVKRTKNGVTIFIKGDPVPWNLGSGYASKKAGDSMCVETEDEE